MLEEPPLLVVKRGFERPDAAKVARLKGAQTGNAVDCMNGRGGLHASIKPVDRDRAAFVGVALTVETGPSDNLAIIGALSVAKPGDVIVAASDAFGETAVVGDIVCGLARNCGIAAIVVDGMARDEDGIRGMGLPVFSRGITPNSCVKSGPGRIGFPIVAGGVHVASGDIVLGDRDGIVIIPRGELDRVLVRLDEIRKAEASVLAKVAAGAKQLDKIAELMASQRVQYLD
jgi:4-hydroxy-4-methyl-2-oxoglutarate aldolase